MKNFETFPWEQLESWYTENGRHDFPWRQYENMEKNHLAYRVWLAEILLQQTQADRVVGFYTKILERFPDIEALAATDYDTFFPFYQ